MEISNELLPLMTALSLVQMCVSGGPPLLTPRREKPAGENEKHTRLVVISPRPKIEVKISIVTEIIIIIVK